MRYGLFSDVHSNLEALVAVLGALEAEKVDQYIFLGDIVGYGADAKACLQLLRKLVEQKGSLCLAGNHDHAVCGLSPYANYTQAASLAVDWTKAQLGPEELGFLCGLKLRDSRKGFVVAHANLELPQNWGYLLDIDDADANFKAFSEAVCFVGHSHKPIVFTLGNSVDWFVGPEIKLQSGVRYIINVGSVGQPRDGDPRACFAIYDQAEGVVQIKRIAYDVAQAQAKINKAGLPRILAERLAVGK